MPTLEYWSRFSERELAERQVHLLTHIRNGVWVLAVLAIAAALLLFVAVNS